ncbi:hypothetical protein FDP41_003728 [Naegleria fowleri]|uniref:Uncharacterized protein n=1 Tax=Naegleria fowleri TaxID=5763 RepID=A0A6A5BUR5_NAEFO|nr:uncharacterized protein FDP41_003728 [Naegleria fowleri]KAF0977075.1 hypothetical protein FDP41_003728 [Naegleria fowleri]
MIENNKKKDSFHASGWKIGSWLLFPSSSIGPIVATSSGSEEQPSTQSNQGISSNAWNHGLSHHHHGSVIFSPTALRMISILATLTWLFIFGLLLVLLIICGVDINFGRAISSCGREDHWLRPFFVATFAVYWVIMSVLFFNRALMLHAKWFGLANAHSGWWRMMCCGLTMPRRRVELKSVAFWLIWSQLLFGLVSNLLLLLMAIFPDQKGTKSFHFVTAFLGLILLLTYTACSVVIHTWRVVKVVKNKSTPFELFRRITHHDSKQFPSKRTWFLLSVTCHTFVIIWQLIFVLAGLGFIPAYVSTYIPAYEWLGVSSIMLALFPHTFDTMMTDVVDNSINDKMYLSTTRNTKGEDDETNSLILK